VPASAGIVKGRHVTCFFAIKDDLVNAGGIWEDKSVVIDKNLVSSRKPDDLPDYCKGLLEVLATAPATM
jgi:protease I